MILLLLLLKFVSCIPLLGPNAEPICSPAGKGGLFGYSTDLVYADGYAWLAIGEPWSSRVHIYRIETSKLDLSPGGAACLPNLPDSNYSFPDFTDQTIYEIKGTRDPKAPKSCSAGAPWTLATSLVYDTTSPLSLFGFSLSWSNDAKYLAIGIPSAGPSANMIALAPHYGAVRVYSRISSSNADMPVFRTHADLNSKSAGRHQYFNDRFGSRVKFARARNSLAIRPDVPYLLLVGSDGGWDGVSAPGVGRPDGTAPMYGVDLLTGFWPSKPTTSTRNMGIYVFGLPRAQGSDPPGSSWKNRQFIPSISSEPMGMFGVSFDADLMEGVPILAMRDAIDDFGAVRVFRFNPWKGVFRELDPIKSESKSFESWFGAAISISSPFGSGLEAIHVGSPKTGDPVKQYVAIDLQDNTTFSSDNTSFASPRALMHGFSFYGGTLVSNNNTLVIVDAVSRSGPGSVYLMHRRTPGQNIQGFEATIAASASDDRLIPTNGTVALTYDMIAMLTKKPNISSFDDLSNIALNSTDPFIISKGLRQDQFGKSVSIFDRTIVVGSALSDCVYIYSDPRSYKTFKEITTTPIVPIKPSQTSEAGKLIAIGAAVSFVVILPLIIFGIVRVHKKRVIKSLQAKKN